MRRVDLRELHYILPVANLPSVLANGLFSHERAKAIPHKSVAKQLVQDQRRDVHVPNARPLHEYVNLYIYARNATLFLMKLNAGGHRSLTVLRISTEILDTTGVVITDQNAASKYCLFRPSPEGLSMINPDEVFAESWKHEDDPIAEWRHKSAMCAEVLVPDHVPAHFITGLYVSCTEVLQSIRPSDPNLEMIVDKHLFFEL